MVGLEIDTMKNGPVEVSTLTDPAGLNDYLTNTIQRPEGQTDLWKDATCEISQAELQAAKAKCAELAKAHDPGFTTKLIYHPTLQ